MQRLYYKLVVCYYFNLVVLYFSLSVKLKHIARLNPFVSAENVLRDIHPFVLKVQPAAAYNARKVHSPLMRLVGRHAGLALAAVTTNMKYARVVQLQMWFAGNADSALLDLR